MSEELANLRLNGELQFRNENEARAFRTTAGAISLGMRLTNSESKPKDHPGFFRGQRDLEEFFCSGGIHGIGMNREVGVVDENTSFVSTRDGWDKMIHLTFRKPEGVRNGAPRVMGRVDGEGRRVIVLDGNAAANDFDSQVLSSTPGRVYLYEDGTIKLNYAGQTRDLTLPELSELEAIFQDVIIKLRERQMFWGNQ